MPARMTSSKMLVEIKIKIQRGNFRAENVAPRGKFRPVENGLVKNVVISVAFEEGPHYQYDLFAIAALRVGNS